MARLKNSGSGENQQQPIRGSFASLKDDDEKQTMATAKTTTTAKTTATAKY